MNVLERLRQLQLGPQDNIYSFEAVYSFICDLSEFVKTNMTPETPVEEVIYFLANNAQHLTPSEQQEFIALFSNLNFRTDLNFHAELLYLNISLQAAFLYLPKLNVNRHEDNVNRRKAVNLTKNEQYLALLEKIKNYKNINLNIAQQNCAKNISEGQRQLNKAIASIGDEGFKLYAQPEAENKEKGMILINMALDLHIESDNYYHFTKKNPRQFQQALESTIDDCLINYKFDETTNNQFKPVAKHRSWAETIAAHCMTLIRRMFDANIYSNYQKGVGFFYTAYNEEKIISKIDNFREKINFKPTCP